MYLIKQGVSTRTLALRTSTFTVLGAACLFSLSPAAMAQTSDEDRFVIDEIIVTARKTEESLQDISLAISAFTKQDIRERSLTELENVALQTPGFTFEDFSNGGFGAPVIRGTSQIRVDQLEQNVSVFYDGIYIPRQYAFDSGLANIERIEVVKGPQSALYGANSFSGAINYVSPTRDLTEFGGEASVGVGTDGLFEARGGISIPVIKDTLAVSVFGSLSDFDGEFDNNVPGAENAPRRGTDETVGGWDRESFGGGLTFNSGGLTVKGDYTRFEALNENRASYTFTNVAQTGAVPGTTDFNCSPGGFTGANRIFCGQLPSTPVAGVSGISETTIDPRSFLEVETEIFRGELNYAFNDNFDITYLYGNVDSDVFSVGESGRDQVAGSTLPLSPFFSLTGNVFTFTPDGGVDYNTHEVRLNYETDSGITALLGGYLLNGEDRDQFSFAFLPLGDFTEITETPAPTGFDILDTDITAVFGRVSVPITETLTISAEARYSETEKTIDTDVVAADGSTSLQSLSNSNSAFTPRVNIDWNVTNDNLLYASVARGVKAGGINTSTVNLSEEETFFDEDENTSFEIGSKNVFADGRVTFNAAAYYIDWNDLQIGVLPQNAGFGTGSIVENLGAATSKGLEFDGAFNPTENFSLNFGLSLIDATYDEGTISSRGAFICDDNVCNSNGDVSGNELARVPDVQWNLGAQYNGDFTNDIEYFIRGDLAGQSQQFVSEFNIATVESRTLTNLRAGVSKGPLALDFWVTNLFDEEYVGNSFFIVSAFQTQYTATLGAGRRAGVELSYDF